ncbi:myosin-2 heavy chain-like [Uranotaenia lowii]|uniref:myosin-2 heavy chain-like n=1 Tax=Uranotaenia lowii TaxID=190385 RepID=UPI00247AC88B|nr:myosin-2 heavy chain-like [Uranotaenia lowii]
MGCKELEEELRELQEFTNLEKNLDLADIKQQVSSSEELRKNFESKEEELETLEERCKDLETELNQKRELIFDIEKELIVARKEREAAVKEAEQCRNLQNSIQVEYELFQQRAKNREKELIESLQEARSTGPTLKGDSQKTLDSTRKELKQLEVHNYELQLELERCAVEVEKLRKVSGEQTEKLEKIRVALEKDIDRKDSKKLFRVVNKLRAIMTDEDLMLINTSLDTDDLVDSMGDSSMSDSMERQSPMKITLTSDTGNTNMLHNKNGSQILDMNIEFDELRKKVKLQETELAELRILTIKYENVNELLNEKENKLSEMLNRLDTEQSKVRELTNNLQTKKKELEKLTVEHDDLSTQLMDYVQDGDKYKEEIEKLQQQLQESVFFSSKLRDELEEARNNQASVEKFKSLEAQLQQTQDQLDRKIEEIQTLSHYKLQCVTLTEELDIKSSRVADFEIKVDTLEKQIKEMEELSNLQSQLEAKNTELLQKNNELKEKLKILEHAAEKEGELRSHLEEQRLKAQLLQEENVDLEVAVQRLSEKIVTLEKQMTKEESTLVAGEATINDSQRLKLETSFELIMEQKEKVAAALPELEIVEARVKSLEEDNDQLLRQLDELRIEKSDLQTTNEMEMKKHTELIENMNAMKKEFESFEASQSLLLKEKIEQVEHLETERQSLLQQLSDIQSQKDILLDLLQEEKKQLEQKNSEQMAIIESCKREITATNKSIDDLCQQQQAFEQERTALLEQIKLAKDELQVALKEVAHQEPSLHEELTKSREELVSLQEQHRVLEKQIKSLQQEHDSLIEEKKKSDEKCEKLSDEITLLITDREKSNESNDIQIKQLQQTKNELQLLNESLKKQLDEINSNLSNVVEEKEKMGKKISNLEAEMEESSNIREHLEAEVTALKKDLNNLDLQVTDNNKKVERYQEEIKELSEKLECEQKAVSQASHERSELQATVGELETKLASLEEVRSNELKKTEMVVREQLTAAEKLINELRNEIVKLTDQNDLLDKEVAEKQLRNEQLEQEISDLRLKINQIEAVREEKQSIEQTLEGQLNKQKELESKIHSLEQQIVDATNEHEAKLRTQQNSCSDLQGRLDHSEARNRLLGEELIVLRENSKISAENSTKLLEQIADLRAEKIQLESQLANVRSESVIIEHKFDAANQELLDKSKQYGEICQKVNEMELIVSKKEQACDELATQIVELEHKNTLLQRQLEEEKSNQKNHTETQTSSLKKTISELEEQIADLKALLATSEDEISQKSKEIQKLVEQCKQEQSLNEKLNEQLETAIEQKGLILGEQIQAEEGEEPTETSTSKFNWSDTIRTTLLSKNNEMKLDKLKKKVLKKYRQFLGSSEETCDKIERKFSKKITKLGLVVDNDRVRLIE